MFEPYVVALPENVWNIQQSEGAFTITNVEYMYKQNALSSVLPNVGNDIVGIRQTV